MHTNNNIAAIDRSFDLIREICEDIHRLKALGHNTKDLINYHHRVVLQSEIAIEKYGNTFEEDYKKYCEEYK